MNQNSLFHPPLLRAPEPGDTSSGDFPPLPTEETPIARRAGSMSLRETSGRGDDDSPLDPANQSLADALRIMLGLLQFGMLILAGLYALSGLQSVKEGEQGIRLLFGAREGSSLDPGLRISFPYPLGELLRINRGYREMAIDRDFWVYIPEGTAPENQSAEKLPPTQSLKPDQGGSGSVLTADGNIAHTRWRVGYRRDDVSKYAQNVLPDDEEKLVRAAVKRGVVQACSQVTIDELLKQSSSQTASISSRAKSVAQRTLDAFDSGIVIDQLTLDQTIPPLWVRSDFARVQAAVADAKKAEDTARSEATSKLNAVAGEAVPHLIKLIELYETQADASDKASQAATLEKIDSLLLGQKVEIDGVTVEGLASGSVSTLLVEARRDRSAAVTRAMTSLATYESKLAQYKANPLLMLQQEWSSAVQSFLTRDNVQIAYVPESLAYMRIMINADPDLERRIDQAIKKRESEDAERKRQEELNQNRFKTKVGITTDS